MPSLISFDIPSHRAFSTTQISKSLPAASQIDRQKAPTSLAEDVRTLMRHVPHPITIVTATNPHQSSTETAEDRPGKMTAVVTKTTSAQDLASNGSPTDEAFIPESWKGLTVSSFNTVTLIPTPVVSFNVKRLSSTFDAIELSGSFNVHVLSLHDKAIELANRFARGNMGRPFDVEGVNVSVPPTPIRGPDSEADSAASTAAAMAREPPRLSLHTEDGNVLALFRIQCRYMKDKTVSVGDHVVVLGEVVDVEALDLETDHEEAMCLAYVGGRYTRVERK